MAEKLTLYEITEELDAIGEALAETGGEVSPELEGKLDAMTGEWERKVEAIALFAQESLANATAARLESDRLAAKAKAFENKARGLKGYLLFAMKRADWDRIKTPLVSVSVVKNSRPAIHWRGNPADAPARYRREVVTVDGTRVYEAWKDGEELDDGFEIIHGEHVRVR